MANRNKTFNTICRVCLQHGEAEKMESLIDNSEENGLSAYGVSFEKLTKLSVKDNGYLPTKLCQKCKISLEEVATFMLRSESSDRKLYKLITFSLKQDLSGEMVKEVVRQYTLFNLQFPEDSGENSRPSTSRLDEDTLPVKNPKEEGKRIPKIKVEVDVQKISLNSSDDDVFSNTVENNLCQSTSDNVDLFLHSIEKLVTTNTGHIIEPIKKDISKKEWKAKAREQDFTCNICHRVLANPFTYKHHMERHGICRYVCDQCGKGFPVLAELTQHLVYLHGIGATLECDQCSYKAARRLDLIEHIRLHTGERPFTCEKCGLTFRRKAIYKNHLKLHGEKTITCDYCPRKFLRRSEMLAHSNNVHNRLYVYMCRICNVTYAMGKTVRKHMLVKHGIPRHKQGKVVKVNKNTDITYFKDSRCGDGEYTDV